MSMIYDVIFGKTPEMLRKAVNDKLEEGWYLYEGIVYADGRFHQVMVKYPEAPFLNVSDITLAEASEVDNELGW